MFSQYVKIKKTQMVRSVTMSKIPKSKKYLGIDIGTTSLKAAVFDGAGKRLGLVCYDYILDTDPATGYIEFDAESYVKMTQRAIAELTESCGKIDALSIDTQGETLILTDGEGNPVYPAVVWLDNRATSEAREIEERFGRKTVYEITGQSEIAAAWPAPKLMWFKKNRPEVWKRTKKIFLLEDYVMYKLSGSFVTEPTVQSSSLYLDIRRNEWWEEMLDFIGVSSDMLPKIVGSCEKIGFYNDVPVVSGMLDQIAGTIGAGVTDGKKISEMTGTIMAICALTDIIPEYNENSVVPTHVHAIPGKYCRILCSSTAGMALKWFKNNFSESFSFKELDALAEKITPGCDGLTMLPYFCGAYTPKYDPEARAVFAGVELSHTRAHFARAIMEAIAFNLKQNLDVALSKDTEEIRITGGGASSPLWASIKANVTAMTLKTLKESETACLGSALSAAVGIGDFTDIAAAADCIVKTDKEYAPSGMDYAEAYERYCKLDEKMTK